MGFASTKDLKSILHRDIRAAREPGDYIGDDGLLVCGKCGTRKESRIETDTPAGFVSNIRPIPCECASAAKAKKEDEEATREKAALIDRLRRDCFPYPTLWGCTFDNDDKANPRVTGICRKYVDSFDRFKDAGAGLMFFGGVGNGKSYYAAMIANALLDDARPVLFTSLSTLGGKMAADYGRNRDSLLRRLTAYDLVVLDDLGVERTTETMNENVYQIVNALYSSRTPIVLTTNLDAAGMLKETDPNRQRIYSRLFECCKAVKVDGADRRRNADRERIELFGLLD